jgi:hypothetical protein
MEERRTHPIETRSAITAPQPAHRRDVLFALASAWSSSGRPALPHDATDTAPSGRTGRPSASGAAVDAHRRAANKA